MTDEDADDDRMERADRIRRMREGRRANGRTGDAENGDDAEQGTVTEAAPAESGVDDSDDDEAADDPAADSTAPGSADDEEAAGEVSADAEPAVNESNTNGQEASETAADASPTDTETTTNGEGQVTADDAGGFEFEQSNGDSATEESNAEELPVETASEAAEMEAGEREAAALPETQRGVAESVTADDAERAVAGLGTRFAIPDQATTVSEDDDALDVEGTVAAARAAAAGRQTATTGNRTRVLEFELGAERFCLDIDYVEEIVELENMTRVPNSPSYVEGVVDLRGQVTAIINPKDALDVGNEGRGDLIIVFDSEQMDEQGHLGWVVDEVRQVTPVSEDEVNESPDEDDEHINGIINREDEDDFVVWTTPELALRSS